MSQAVGHWLKRLQSRWEAWALHRHRRRRSLMTTASILVGMLALTGLGIGVTQAAMPGPPEEAAACTTKANADAETIGYVDTVLVYDKSSSMEYDTLCYGCSWYWCGTRTGREKCLCLRTGMFLFGKIPGAGKGRCGLLQDQCEDHWCKRWCQLRSPWCYPSEPS